MLFEKQGKCKKVVAFMELYDSKRGLSNANFFSNSDTFWNVWFKILHALQFFFKMWRIVNFRILNHAFQRSNERQRMSFSLSNVFQRVFWMLIFFKLWNFWNVFFKLWNVWFFFSKLRAVNFLNQNHAFRRSTKNWKYVVFTK